MSPSVEPFNEAKYKDLMDGLDFQEINKSELENEFTIGAEYYGKKYVEVVSVVKRQTKTIPLGKMWVLATDGDHGSPDYQESGVLYLLSECVKEGYIEKAKCRYITEAKNRELKRSCLHPGDIVVTKTGVYFGKSAVIPESIPEANTIAHVGKITLKSQYNPYYVSTFLNCKYGYYQLRRRGIKATRPEIKLVEFPDIIVPEFSKKLYSEIEATIRTANNLLDEADNAGNQSEQILMQALNMPQITDKAVSIKNFSDSFATTGRLDSEYYKPKFDILFDTLSKFSSKPLGGDNGITNIKKSIEPGSDSYKDEGIPFVRVSDVSKYEITSPEIYLSHDVVENVAALFPKKDTILFSKDGSVGIAYKLERDEDIITSGALLHLTVKNTSEVLPDYLTLVLNSPVVQMQAERDSNGAIIQHWKPSEIENVIIPVLGMDKQRELAEMVQKSFALRRQSKQLLEYAKQTVEMAIEQGEDAALAWLKDKVEQ